MDKFRAFVVAYLLAFTAAGGFIVKDARSDAVNAEQTASEIEGRVDARLGPKVQKIVEQVQRQQEIIDRLTEVPGIKRAVRRARRDPPAGRKAPRRGIPAGRKAPRRDPPARSTPARPDTPAEPTPTPPTRPTPPAPNVPNVPNVPDTPRAPDVPGVPDVPAPPPEVPVPDAVPEPQLPDLAVPPTDTGTLTETMPVTPLTP